MTIAFVPSRLANLEVFRDAELDELRLLAQHTPLHDLLDDPAWREASAIDFAYTSGRVEGNTYSREDANALLTAGTIAAGKSPQETQMLLNLRDAHTLILDNAHEIVQAGLAGFREIHRVLMRQILPAEQLGATRTTRHVRITGTDYMPPHGAAYLDGLAAEIFAGLARAANPFDACLYAACNLSYLQLFEDGNKRASRVIQNALLVAAGLSPMLLPESMVGAYLDAQLVYYEAGDYLMHRGLMLEAFRFRAALN
ncbi:MULTISPECIES: Fic family protein [unclassified Variovorax]|uniref:Fic family protein n=1 Tax=unclassified Variovorax TaxID=663243 RepID=UPI00076BC7BE|nr:MULTISPECIES: Fic family protein [unclassified Variovorax]KWT97688.1 hypothetical protein APY03_1240 [Variovorax sp. WDL1]